MEYKVGQQSIKLAYYEDGKSYLFLSMDTSGLYTVTYDETVTSYPEHLWFDFGDFISARKAFANISSFLLSARYFNQQYFFDDTPYSLTDFYNHIKELASDV